MAEQSSLDRYSNYIYGIFDGVSKGIGTYFNGAIAYNEAQAALATSKANKNTAKNIEALSVGTAASTGGDPNGVLNVNLNSTQGVLILGAVALVGFAVLKGK